jgi:hypothetical protein
VSRVPSLFLREDKVQYNIVASRVESRERVDYIAYFCIFVRSLSTSRSTLINSEIKEEVERLKDGR